MELAKDKQMQEKILAAEQDLEERQAQLNENMEKITPIIWVFIGAVIIVAIFMLVIHPIRYRGDKGIDGFIQLLEKTDPLFISYMDLNASLYGQSVIAALFSLKQRGIITLLEVPSVIDKKETTFR